MTRPATIEADVDGIQSLGQAAEKVVDQTSTALAERKPTHLAPAEPGNMTPMQMAYHLIQNGADLGSVKEMLAMSKELAAEQARRAFTEAFAAFKSEAVTVVRGRKVTDGPLRGKSYAELYSFVDAVTPALSKHGLSASWAITKDEKDWIEVTCTIEHVLGHFKTVSMGGPPDVGGAKNPIQARASTVTYLERHTLKAATGIAEQGDDKDGNGPPNGPSGQITQEQAATIRALIEETETDIQKFCELMKVESVPELAASQYDRVIKSLEAKKRRVA